MENCRWRNPRGREGNNYIRKFKETKMRNLGEQTYCIDPGRDSCRCKNCDGRHCMSCVMRIWDHICQNDCPICCIDETEALQKNLF